MKIIGQFGKYAVVANIDAKGHCVCFALELPSELRQTLGS